MSLSYVVIGGWSLGGIAAQIFLAMFGASVSGEMSADASAGYAAAVTEAPFAPAASSSEIFPPP